MSIIAFSALYGPHELSGVDFEVVKAIAAYEAQQRRESRILPMPARDEDEVRFFCANCADEPSAWQIVWCPGVGDARALSPNGRALSTRIAECGRWKKHEPHTYGARCACVGTNPVTREHQRRMDEARTRRTEQRKKAS